MYTEEGKWTWATLYLLVMWCGGDDDDGMNHVCYRVSIGIVIRYMFVYVYLQGIHTVL